MKWLSLFPKRIPDEFDTALSSVKYVKSAYGAYVFVKKKRIKHFLMTLSNIEYKMTESDRKKLQKYLDSKQGQELLGEFIDSVHQTSSNIANCALAFLLADVSNETYREDFKIAACHALKGLDDESVNAFIQLTDEHFLSRRARSSDGPYPIYILEVDNVEGKTEMQEYAPQLEMFVSYIHLLTTRGLLMPDYAGARLGDSKPTAQPYGVGERAKEFRKLLIRAKEVL